MGDPIGRSNQNEYLTHGIGVVSLTHTYPACRSESKTESMGRMTEYWIATAQQQTPPGSSGESCHQTPVFGLGSACGIYQSTVFVNMVSFPS